MFEFDNTPDNVNNLFEDDFEDDFEIEEDLVDDVGEEVDSDESEEIIEGVETSSVDEDEEDEDIEEFNFNVMSDDEHEDISKIESSTPTPTPQPASAEEAPKKRRGRPPKNKAPETTTPVASTKVEKPVESKVQNQKTKYEPMEWEYKLRTMVGDHLEIREFDKQLYYYKHILDPAGKKTGYFTCHCNINNDQDDNGDLVWHSDHHCLSGVYSPIHMEKMIEGVKKNIDIQSDRVYSKNPFILSWRGATKQSVPVFDNAYKNKIFAMLTGISTDELDIMNNVIEINLDNSYNGKSSIRASFIINLKLKDGASNKQHRFRDFFTLHDQNDRIYHRGTFEELRGKLEELPTKIDKKVEFLQSIPIIESDERKYKRYFDAFMFHIRGNYRKEFLATWSKVPGSMKNLYFALLVLSWMLNQSFDNKRRHEWSNSVNRVLKLAGAKI